MRTDASGLPGVLAEIADAAGPDAAWALAQAQGGTTVFFPKAVEEGHWLAELVGLAPANQICAYFRTGNSGANILIPMARRGQQKQRLVRALEDGMSAANAALVAGMHERSAFRTRKVLKAGGKVRKRRKPDDDKQFKLL